jgi:LCP family protein required for cell wall assembly
VRRADGNPLLLGPAGNLSCMADRPRDPDDRGYGWLYGASEDDEATRRIPVSRRRPPDRHRAEAGRGDDPDPTRVMPVGGRSGERAGYDRPRPRPSAPPPPRARASRGRRRTRPRWGRILVLVLLLWLVFLIAVPVWAMSTIEEVDAEPSGERPDNTLGSVYLLVGSDSREGLTAAERKKLHTGNAEGERTDTILLLYEPPLGGKTLLVSLPRDSVVDIPGYGSEKINAAYSFGGPKLLVQTVENETGLYVDNYVEIGLGGFVNLVDAVDGVQICPKTAMNDRLAGLHIKKGCQQADGVTALGYARSRHTYATGDIQRGEAQREVIGQVASKAASPWSVINPFRYYALNKAGADALRVGENVGPIDMARFALAVRKVSGKSEDGKTCTVPIADLSVHWDTDRAQALFNKMQEGETDHISKRLCSKTGLRY